MALPVEDILAIQKLAADYNHLIDSGSAEAWAQLFVPDGTLEFGMPEGVKGHEDLTAFAAAINPATRHVISNLSIDGQGDEAVANVYLEVYYTAPPGQPRELIITGVYRDHLRKDDGRWRYVSRQMTPDLGEWAPVPESIPER